MRIPSHLRALLTKNWILWKRNSLGSFLEFTIPILFALLFLVFRNAEPIVVVRKTSYYQSPYVFSEPSIATPFMKNCQSDTNGGQVALAPGDDEIIQELGDILAGIGQTVMYFENNQAIDDYTQRSDYGIDAVSLCFAVVMSKNNISNQYEYLIRYNISMEPGNEDIPNTSENRINQIVQQDTGTLLKYATSGFLTIQTWLDTLILRKETNVNTARIDASVASVTVPAHREDDLMLSLLGTPQYFIGMPLLLPFLRMINGILKEKEKRIREGMKIMGLSNSAFYVSWFITYFLIMTVLSLSIAIILTLGIFTNSSLGLIFLWHWGYSICLISFGTLITVFFSRAKVGNIVGFVIIFLLEWVQQVVSGNDVDATQRFWASLALPASVAMAGDQILRLEASQQGLKAHTANLLFLNYKVSYHFMWMAIETVVFLLLAVYLDQVIPSEFGVRKHPLFCLRRSKKRKYVKMSPQKTEKILTEEGLVEQSLTEENENFEDPDPALKAQDKSGESIMIRNLKKVYGNGKVAVDGVTYNMYKGQIFVLLGHNGAGKTTTISMMTGLYPSTEGTTIAFGMDINEKLDEVRKTMGVCPQHDVLFDDLTVKEHLELFAVFKGMNSKDINAEVDKLMTDLDLQEKKDYISKNLSGGQKRRLSIAIAFIGGSRFILLDEPSSGMDTSARRRLWDMLKNNKHGRVILLTTHYMDEADYLGDRIGIMGEGKMQCLGRPLFLKNQFGVGYTLTLSKKDPRDDSIPAIKFVQSFIPEAKVVTDVSLEISFQLPLETVNKFQELFENLDKSLGTFNLETYGVSVTTLEQVFLNVAKLSSTSDHEIARQFSRDQLAQGNFTNEDLDNFDLRKERISQQWSLFATQFAALMMKRFHYFKRDRRGLLLELLIPVIVIIGGILLTKANFIPSVKSIYLSDDLYGDTFDVRYGPLPTGSDTFINGLNSTTFNLTQVPTATSIANLDTAVYGYRTNADTFSKFNMLINSLDTSIDYYNYSVLVDTRAQEASAFSFNKLNNAVLKYATGDDSKQITVVVSPFEHTASIKQIENAIDGLSIAFVFSIGMSFIPASLITFIVKERELTVKHQQLISGVSIRAYWFANYLVDIIKYMIPGILNSIMAVALDAESLIEGDKYGVVWALFLLYGFSVTSFSYLTSFLFKDFGIAQIATYFFHFGSGFIGGLSVGLLRIFGRTNSAARVLQWIFRPFPTFALTYGLMNLTNEDIYQRVEGNSVSRSPWALDLSGGDVLYLAITSIVYLALVFLVEYLRTKKFPIPTFIKIKLKKTETTTTPKYIDEDVKEEVRKIEEGIIPNLSIKVDKLRKLYSIGKGKHKVAVNQVSFGVQNGDCFALLGVNGAGKTTTFKMLTGDVIPSSGKAYINGYEIPSKLAHARHDIGYCPQNDPLLENLTAKEHLYLYTAIRGIPSYKRKRMIQKQLKDMSLTEYANVPANALSGGNKRKLAVAIAMVGNPPIVFLDEPSTGMDPEARRFMWNVISRISRERKKSSVVLTTHSMEEAEALSTKIGIMVDGVMVCIGSAQHIKSKYGGGYEVEVKLNLVPKKKVQENIKSLNYEPNTLLTKSQIDSILKDTGAPYLSRQISEQGSGSPIYLELKKGKVSIEFVMDWILIEKSGEKLKEFLEKKFDGAVLVEHFQSFYRFTISSSVGIGQVFGEIEANKNMLNIMQYSVRQSTIEQIFNMFASDHSHSMARKKLESYKQRAKLKEKEKEKEKAKEIALNIKDQVHETKTKPKAPISRITSFRTLDPPMKPTTVINLEEDV